MTKRNITREEIESLWERSIAPGMTIEMTLKPAPSEVEGPPSDEPEAAPPAAEKEATDLSSSLTVADRIEVREQTIADAGKVIPPPQYELLDVLGEGGMGTVFRARQTSMDRPIALKMLRPESADRRRDRDRFLSEAVATGDLDHPNIIPVYDLGANEGGQLFYAMKEVRGTPWEEVLDGKPLQENLSILLRVADAVAFAHSRGIIHRDLKPDNVMLGDYGEVMLTDWGLAVSVTEEGKAARLEEGHTVGGTPSYMAPELAAGDIGLIGPCSDVYLLGAILFRIVTGRSPHSGDGVMECLRNAANNVIELPEVETGKKREQELLDIARKAMSTSPGERHRDVKTFQADVREYLHHAESITLAEHAAADLEKAQQSRDYRDYARAQSGYEQALNLWAENERARTGISDAQLAYAACAFERGDFDLAESLLDPEVASHRSLAKRIETARRERDAHVRRLRTFKTVAAVSAAAVLFLGIGAFLWVRSEQQKTVVAELDALKAEKTARELEEQRLESWIPVCEFDFTKVTELDERFDVLHCGNISVENRTAPPNPDAVSLGPEDLTVKGYVNWWGGLSMMRWNEEIGEDLRVEVTAPGNQFFILSVAGDSLNGYRAVFDLRSDSARPPIELDTIAEVDHRIFALARGEVDKTAKSHVAVLEKSGQTIRVDIDGVRQIEYWDPLPFAGEGHRTFALGAWWSDARFTSLRVWRRRSPEVVSVLEIGRELLRLRRLEEAERFFAEKCSTHADTMLGMEAEFLLGTVLQYQGREQEALALFEEVANLAAPRSDAEEPDTEERGRLRLGLAALNQAAQLFTEGKDFEKACTMAFRAYELDPSAPAPNTVYAEARPHLYETDAAEERYRLLTMLTRLPIRDWELPGLELDRLPSFAGSRARSLRCTDTGIKDLSPLKGSQITRLDCGNNKISDLTPLQGLPLTTLGISGNRIIDLSPLRGMSLLSLNCDNNEISDLSPLKDMPLRSLSCEKNAIVDLSALRGMPLTDFDCSLNPVSDLSPLEGVKLQTFSCVRTRVTDLSPLRGMPLTVLRCFRNRISDLGPLTGMPLVELYAYENRIRDLAPLEGMQLRTINVSGNQIRDLSPLNGMKLETVEIQVNGVTNLAPLKGMPMKHIDFNHNMVSDLSPLSDSPLERIECEDTPIEDLSPLRGMTTLRSLEAGANKISDLSPLEGLRLQRLDMYRNAVSDLSPLKGMPLKSASFSDNNVSDLAPLRGMPLEMLGISGNPVTDLSALKGLPLGTLSCAGTQVTDLSPLEGMPLWRLDVTGIPLSPENVRIIVSSGVRSLYVDLLAPTAMDMVRRQSGLQKVNGYTVEHLRRVGDEVLAAFRGESANLREHAARFGEFRWLIVPHRVPREAAAEFCKSQGGYLACPATKEKREALASYMREVSDSNYASAWSGAIGDKATGKWRWASGERWTVEGWDSESDRLLSEETGQAWFSVWENESGLRSLGSAGHPSLATMSFIIEWRDGE